MRELFHIPQGCSRHAFLDQTFEVIDATPQHIFQILTRRAPHLPQLPGRQPLPVQRMAWRLASGTGNTASCRIEPLRKFHTTVRFLLVEPLLKDGEWNLR